MCTGQQSALLYAEFRLLLLLACVLVPTVLSQTVALPGVLACQTAKCAGVDGGSRGCSHMHQLAPEFFVMMPFSSPLQ